MVTTAEARSDHAIQLSEVYRLPVDQYHQLLIERTVVEEIAVAELLPL